MNATELEAAVLELIARADALEARDAEFASGIDTMWILLTGIGIMMMQTGFLGVEVGATRAKSVKSVLFKNLMDFASGAVAWFVIGYGLYLGDDPFVAGEGSTFLTHPPSSNYALLFQQFGFAATAATIVSGAVLGRMRLQSYVVYSFVISGFFYPIMAHWSWGSHGWLKELGFKDFAGSMIVHAFGGMSGIVAAWCCGPRVTRYAKLRSDDNNESDGEDQDDGEKFEASFHGAQVGQVLTATTYHNALARTGSANTPSRSPSASRAASFTDRGTESSMHGGSQAGSFQLHDVSSSSPSPATLFGKPLKTVKKKRSSQSFTPERRGLWRLLPRCNRLQARNLRLLHQPGHSPAIQSMGALFLFFAWFFFNAGSTLSFSTEEAVQQASLAAMNTLLSAGAAIFCSLWFSVLSQQGKTRARYNLDFLLNCFIGGLVAVTAPCAFIEGWAALLLGALAVPVYASWSWIMSHVFLVDDPVDVGAVHFACGVLGTLYLGLFDTTEGLFYTGNARLLGVQALGILVISGWALVCNCLFFVPLRYFRRGSYLVYSRDEQIVGLDLVHFGGNAFADMEERDLEEADNSLNGIETGSASQRSDGDRSEHSGGPTFGAFGGTTEKALYDVLQNSRMRKRFRRFLGALNDENVLFWDQVTAFKAVRNPDKRGTLAAKIVREYVLPSAEKQINLSSAHYKAIVDVYEQKDQAKMADLTYFDQAMEELFKDLKVAFRQFVQSTPNYWL